MIGFLLLPLIILVLILILVKARNYMKMYRIKGTVFLTVLFGLGLFSGLLCLILAFFLRSGSLLKKGLFAIGYYWLGIIVSFIVSIVIAIVLRLIIKPLLKSEYIQKLTDQLLILFVIVFTSVMSFYGILNAHNIRIKDYEITINKESGLDELNIAFVSDLHLGYNIRVNETQDMVSKINELNPDVVLIGGDIFDNEYDALFDEEKLIESLKSIRSEYGVYTCLGNHDIEEKNFMGFTFSDSDDNVCADDRMINFINQSNITILYDDYIQIEDIYIYGRPDYEKPNLNNDTRLSVTELMNKMDKTRPIIILDHEPRQAIELAGEGADLLLNGHTHKGQIWPGTLLINLFWDNAYGYKQYGNLHNIVTSGIGLFGVNMRSDSYAEICNIKVRFK